MNSQWIERETPEPRGGQCLPCHCRHLLVQLVIDMEFGAVLFTVVLVLARICYRLVLYR